MLGISIDLEAIIDDGRILSNFSVGRLVVEEVREEFCLRVLHDTERLHRESIVVGEGWQHQALGFSTIAHAMCCVIGPGMVDHQ